MPSKNDSTAARSQPGPPPETGQAIPPKTTGTRYARGERLRQLERWVPGFAVGLVAISAVVTALMSSRFDAPETAVAQQTGASTPVAEKGVVTAPPLKAPAPASMRQARNTEPPYRGATSTMGAAPACRNCGVVETVVAVHGYADPKASGYQMHIRMDDGSVRTVEQRGALAAGSRVVVDRATVRVLTERAGQG